MEFEREETPTVMDGTVIRWQARDMWANYPEINASRNGVSISGCWPVMKNVEQVKAILDEAYSEHLRLSKER